MSTHSRRRFLKDFTAISLAGGSVLGARAGAAATGGKRKMTSLLDCNVLRVPGVSQTEAIELAHRHGFDSVVAEADYLGKLSDSQLEELLGRMKSKGVAFGAAKLLVRFRRDESQFVADLRGFPAVAAVLKRAGVQRMFAWIPPSHGRLTYLKNFRQHTRRLHRVAEILKDHDIRLGLEYIGPKRAWTKSLYPFIHTMTETKELIAEIGIENVGLVLDSWHWFHAGETKEDVLSLTGTDIVMVDVNDAPAGVPRDQMHDLKRELPLATGVIDLRTFLGAVSRLGYDGPVRVETFNDALGKLPKETAVGRTAAAMKEVFTLIQ